MCGLHRMPVLEASVQAAGKGKKKSTSSPFAAMFPRNLVNCELTV